MAEVKLTQDQKDMIDIVGKFIAGLAGFILADRLIMGGAVTPDFIKPFAGLLVCGGAFLLAWRAVRK